MSFPQYERYKESGVEWLGEVPEHWDVKKLSWLFLYSKGTNAALLTKDYIGQNQGDFPVFSGQTENDGIMGEIDWYDFDFRIPVIFITTVGAKAMSTRIVKGKFSLSQNCALAIPRRTNIVSEYYEGALRPLFEYEKRSISLIMQPSLRFEDLNRFRVPLPPLPEQQAIAAFLDRETSRIDSLIGKKKKLVELLAEQRTALISRAVTKGLDAGVKLKPSGVEWLGEVPEHWSTWKLSHGFEFIGSGTTPPSDELEWYDDGSIPWITTSELRESVIFSTEKSVTREAVLKFSALKIFPKGSLAIAMYGATIGRLGIFGIDATTNQACCVMNGGHIFSISFVYFWMQAFKESIILLASGGGQPNISQDKIRSIKIPCPLIHEQQAIAAFLDRETSRIDALVSKVEKAIDKLKEYRMALISAAVTGKIDVRGQYER